MVHPLLWPASTTISSSSSPQSHWILSLCAVHKFVEKLTGLAAVVVFVLPLLIVGVRLAENCPERPSKAKRNPGIRAAVSIISEFYQYCAYGTPSAALIR